MTTRLPAAARTLLKAALRAHPDIRRHVKSKTAIATMDKSELLALAAQLSIDVDALIQKGNEQPGLGGILEPEQLAVWEHSERHPAFKGRFDFDMEIRVLGHVVKRKARVTYLNTPEWEYFDLHLNRPHVGWEGWQMNFEILAEPEGEAWDSKPGGGMRKRRNIPYWTTLNLEHEHALFSQAVHDAIEAEMDRLCREEDGRRRMAAQAVVGSA